MKIQVSYFQAYDQTEVFSFSNQKTKLYHFLNLLVQFLTCSKSCTKPSSQSPRSWFTSKNTIPTGIRAETQKDKRISGLYFQHNSQFPEQGNLKQSRLTLNITSFHEFMHLVHLFFNCVNSFATKMEYCLLKCK